MRMKRFMVEVRGRDLDDDQAEKLVKMGVPKSAVYVTRWSPGASLETSGRSVTVRRKHCRSQLKTVDTEYIVTRKAGSRWLRCRTDRRSPRMQHRC